MAGFCRTFPQLFQGEALPLSYASETSSLASLLMLLSPAQVPAQSEQAAEETRPLAWLRTALAPAKPQTSEPAHGATEVSGVRLRPEEEELPDSLLRRGRLSAAFTLGLVMAAHALIETARDALFLQQLPAVRLPWTYVAIAALTYLTVRHSSRLKRQADGRAVERLLLTLGGASIGTLCFGLGLSSTSPALAFTFYVWSGLLSTLIALRFWVLLGSSLSLRGAKRMYGSIAVAGTLGATLGAGLASRLLTVFSAEALVIFAAGFFAAAACVSTTFPAALAGWRRRQAESSGPKQMPRRPRRFVQGLAVLAVLATVTLTGMDFLVKATVARDIGAESLGSFFANFYFILHGGSLAFQLAVAPWCLRVFGLRSSLASLPLMLTGATVILVLLGGLLPAIMIKAVDGSLRHTVYRSAFEVFYVRLPAESLETVKASIDSTGQRLAQAAGSLVLLGATSFGLSLEMLAVALLALGAVWLIAAVALPRTLLAS